MHGTATFGLNRLPVNTEESVISCTKLRMGHRSPLVNFRGTLDSYSAVRHMFCNRQYREDLELPNKGSDIVIDAIFLSVS